MQVPIASHVRLVRRTLRDLPEQEQYNVPVTDSIDRAVDVIRGERKPARGTAFELLRKLLQIDRLPDSGAEHRTPHFIAPGTPANAESVFGRQAGQQSIQIVGSN